MKNLYRRRLAALIDEMREADQQGKLHHEEIFLVRILEIILVVVWLSKTADLYSFLYDFRLPPTLVVDEVREAVRLDDATEEKS